MHYARVIDIAPGIWELDLLDGDTLCVQTFNTDRSKLETLKEWWENAV